MVVKTQDNIQDTETQLKNMPDRKEYHSIEETIKNNESKMKHLMQQKKFKKFNYLKIQRKFNNRGKTSTN